MKVNQEAINMIKEGISLNKINKKTRIQKSSLYYHYKKIKGKKYLVPKIDKFDMEKIGEFIGIFAGDGSFFFDKKRCHYSIRIYTGLYEKEYRKYLKKFLKKFFGKASRTYQDNKLNVVTNEYYSKIIYEFILEYLAWNKNKTKTIRLKNIRKHSREFLIGFIRGLLDTDGGIYKPKKKVAFGTASKKLAFQIKEILEILGIKPGFYKYKNKDFWYIDIYGERSKKFMEIIKPNNPNKVMQL